MIGNWRGLKVVNKYFKKITYYITWKKRETE